MSSNCSSGIERRPLSGGGEFRSGKTPYETLTRQPQDHQGVANVEDVRIEGPSVGLALVGLGIDPARELDLKGRRACCRSPREPPTRRAGFELPFVVQGPWDDPIMLPDPQSRIQRSGAAHAHARRGARAHARDAVRSAIERLTAAPAAPAISRGAGCRRRP